MTLPLKKNKLKNNSSVYPSKGTKGRPFNNYIRWDERRWKEME